MKNKIFQINIDTSVLRRLRDKVNENQNISYNKQYKKYRAWDKICAIMDRLDDTVDYLNQLKLNTGKYRRSAFDFYDFMNNSAVVCDCIKELAQIFDVDDEELEHHQKYLIKLVQMEKELTLIILNIYVLYVPFIL